MRNYWGNMTSDNLNINERAEIIRLARMAAVRAAQIIIQSRDGSRAYTKCNPYASGHATFNLSLQEASGEIDKEVKRAMGCASERWSLCIEVFLRTHEEDVLTLETWNISLLSGYADNSKLCRHSLAGRFCILLKTLLAITRVVPAYRYSRQQNTDSWTIAYRVYGGEPMCQSLGTQYKRLAVGNIHTPIGLFQVSLNHRTNMTISPQPSGINTSLILKSDHFRPDFSPKHANRLKSSDDSSKSSISDEGPKIGAFVNSRPESVARSEDDPFSPTTMPFGSLLSAKTLLQQSPTNAVNGNELCERLKAIQVDKDDANGNVPVAKSVSSCNDDYIVVDLAKSPFAEKDGNADLGSCYKEWKGVPHSPTQPAESNFVPKTDSDTDADAEIYANTEPKTDANTEADVEASDQLGDLVSQLEYLETSLEEFDDAVTSMLPEDADHDEDNCSQLET